MLEILLVNGRVIKNIIEINVKSMWHLVLHQNEMENMWQKLVVD